MLFWPSITATPIPFLLSSSSSSVALDRYSSYRDPITKATIIRTTKGAENPLLALGADAGGGSAGSSHAYSATTALRLASAAAKLAERQQCAIGASVDDDDGVIIREQMMDDVLRSLFFFEVVEGEGENENGPTQQQHEHELQDPFGTCFPLLEDSLTIMPNNFQSLDMMFLQSSKYNEEGDDEWGAFLRRQLLISSESSGEEVLPDHEEEILAPKDNEGDDDAEDVQITNNPVVLQPQQRKRQSRKSKKKRIIKTRKVPRRTMLSNITSYDAEFLDSNVLDDEMTFRELLEQVRLPTFYYEDYYTDNEGNEYDSIDDDDDDDDDDDEDEGDNYNEEYTQQIVEPPTFPSSEPPSPLPSSVESSIGSRREKQQQQVWGIDHRALSEIPKFESSASTKAVATTDHLRCAFVAFPHSSSSSISTTRRKKIKRRIPDVGLMELASSSVAEGDGDGEYYYYEYQQYDVMLDQVFLKRKRIGRIDYDEQQDVDEFEEEEEDRAHHEPTYYTCTIGDVFTVYAFVEEELLDHEDLMWSVEDQLQPPFLLRSALSQPRLGFGFINVPSPRCELSDLRVEPVDAVCDRRNGRVDKDYKPKPPSPLVIHALIDIDSPQCNLDELRTQALDDVVDHNNMRRRLRQLELEPPAPSGSTATTTSRFPSQRSIRQQFAELRRRQQQRMRATTKPHPSTTSEYGHHDFEDSAAFHDLLEQLQKIPFVVEQYEEVNVETEELDEVVQADDDIDAEIYTALRQAVGEQNWDDLDEADIERYLLLRRSRDDEKDEEDEDSSAATANAVGSSGSVVADDDAGVGGDVEATNTAEAVLLLSEETEAVDAVEVDNSIMTTHHVDHVEEEEEEEEEDKVVASMTRVDEKEDGDDELIMRTLHSLALEEELEEEVTDDVVVESLPVGSTTVEEEARQEEEDEILIESSGDEEVLVDEDDQPADTYYAIDEEEGEEEEEDNEEEQLVAELDVDAVNDDDFGQVRVDLVADDVERKPSYFAFDDEEEEEEEEDDDEVLRKPSYFSFDEDEEERVEEDVYESSSDEEENVGSAEYAKQLDEMIDSVFDESDVDIVDSSLSVEVEEQVTEESRDEEFLLSERDSNVMAALHRRRREQQIRQLPILDSSDEEGDVLNLDVIEPEQEVATELLSHNEPVNIVATTDGTEIKGTEEAEDDIVATVHIQQEEGEVAGTNNVDVATETLEDEKIPASTANDTVVPVLQNAEASLQAERTAGAATAKEDGFQIDVSLKMSSHEESPRVVRQRRDRPLFSIDTKILKSKILQEDDDILDDIDLQILRDGCDWDVMNTNCVDNLDAPPSVDDVEMLWHRWRDLNEDDGQLYQAEEQLLIESNVELAQQETMEDDDD